MTRLLCTCTMVIILGLPRLCVGALIQSDFESDPNGTSPPSGWVIAGFGSGESQVTNATSAQGEQSLFLTNDSSHSDSTTARAAFATQSSGILLLTGFARAEQTNKGITPLGLIDSSNNRANVIRFGDDGTFIFEDGTTTTSTGVSYVAGEWYYFEQTINLDSHLWDFSILDSGNSPIASASNLEFDNHISSVGQIRSLAGVTTPAVSWYIDDVSLTMIPEPRSVFLAALGLLSLGFVAWRQRRRGRPVGVLKGDAKTQTFSIECRMTKGTQVNNNGLRPLVCPFGSYRSGHDDRNRRRRGGRVIGKPVCTQNRDFALHAMT